MIIGTAAQARADKFRVDSHGAGAWIRPYFGTGAKALGASKPDTGAPLPMLYLVEQDAGTTIPPHFHQVTQFQVAVAGHGKIGERELKPVTVHYTHAFTGYGPLQASSEGMSYFTVRNAFDPGLRPLPEAKQELMEARQTPRGNKPLNIVAQPVALSSKVDQAGAISLLSDPSGAAATMHSLPSNANLKGMPIAQDRVWLIVGGEARLEEAGLQTMDGVFQAAGEQLAFHTLASSAQMLELRFPN